MSSIVLILNVASAWLMTGVIWIIQILHYPAFAVVDRAQFSAFHQRHSARITWVVFPAMATELATSCVLARSGSLLAMLGLACAVTTWIVTAALSVPAHTRLTRGFDSAAHNDLVRTNWLRTVAFTAHALLSVALMGQAIR